MEIILLEYLMSTEDDCPQPAPPMGKKSDIFHPEKFTDVDKRAAEAPGTLALSFPDLAAYLTDGLTSDLRKLRSLFMWIGTRELLDTSAYPLDVPDTPYEYLKQITQPSSDGLLSFLLNRLCRCAGLPCKVVLEGYNKRYVGYSAGDNIEETNGFWTVVFVDGSWRIVDTELAFTGVVTEASDWILLEDSGQAIRERVSCEARTVQNIDNTLFLPDPEDFIYFCFPDDPAWQLLAEPWSKEKFINTPVVTWHYLRTTWHLADRHGAVVEAPDGRCCISMDQVPEDQTALRYKLFYSEKRSKKKFTDSLQLDNYIKLAGTKGQLSVLTRLPQCGIYKLDILDGNKSELCQLLIKSTGKTEAAKPFPPIPETGLGFNQAAIDAGLVDPSREDGLVVAREGEKVRFRFRTKKPLDVVTRLLHSVMPSQLLDSRVTHEEEDGVITINVTVPWHAHNPEFSLQVDAKPKDSDDDRFVNALNYLLTSDRRLVHSIKGKEQQLHEELAAATDDDDMHRLESAIQEFRAGHMKDDDLYVKACNRLYDLHHSAVESALRDEDKLDTALRDVEQSQVVYMLHTSPWLLQAQEVHRRMRRLSSMKHKVQSLSGRQVSEIQTYNHPNTGIKDTVVATYILLGENMKKLKKWSYVQTLLRGHGNQSILRRIQNHDVSQVDKQRMDKASSLLNASTAEELCCMSISAAALYNWSKAVVETMAESQNNNNNNDVTNAQQEEEDNKEGEEISEHTQQRREADDSSDDDDHDHGTDEPENKEQDG